MLCTVEQKEMKRLPMPKPSIETWKTLALPGQFKVHVQAMGLKRWIVFNELPKELQYDEWLYIGKDGIPLMYWHATLSGVMWI
jgi:hypothetical protein